MSKLNHDGPVKLQSHTMRKISVEACCDPRSAMKVLRGEPTSILVRSSVLRAIKILGLEHLLPSGDSNRAA